VLLNQEQNFGLREGSTDDLEASGVGSQESGDASGELVLTRS
jgi:hypothetical protein